MAEWKNWAGNVACTPRSVRAPKDEAEIVETLAEAARQQWAVRVAGSGHSFVPLVASDGIVLDLSGLSGIARFETEPARAWVRAGTKLHDLGEPLLERGLAMQNLGDIDVQALGGAIGTGTHGTGPTLQNLSARVSGLRILCADGSLRVLREDTDPDALRAARVSMGALGVVTAARIDLVPAYRLHERIERLPMDALRPELGERIAATRHFEFFWYPGRDLAEAKHLHPTDEPESDLPDRRGERIGWSHRILPSVRDDRFLEMEYSVPAADGPACFDEIRACIRAHHPQVEWPVEYRTLAADDAWLSTAHERDSVTISVHQGQGLPHEALFADAERIFAEYAGRPHWGKMHTLGAEALGRLYPRFDAFTALRDEWDPDRRFANAALERLFGP